jgi:hypothetical protein
MPPLTPTVAEPLHWPAQLTGALLMSNVVGAGAVTVAVAMLMQPEPLVT